MNRIFLAFLFIVVLITVLPADPGFFEISFVLSFILILLLSAYRFSHYSFFYIHSKSGVLLKNESMIRTLFHVSMRISLAIVFLFGSIILISRLIILFGSLIPENFLNMSWILAAAFLITGAGYILLLNILLKVVGQPLKSNDGKERGL